MSQDHTGGRCAFGEFLVEGAKLEGLEDYKMVVSSPEAAYLIENFPDGPDEHSKTLAVGVLRWCRFEVKEVSGRLHSKLMVLKADRFDSLSDRDQAFDELGVSELPVVAEPEVSDCIQGSFEDFDDDDIVEEFDEPVDEPVAVEVEVEVECEVDMTPVITEPQVADCIQGTYEDFNPAALEPTVDIGGSGSFQLTCNVISRGGTQVVVLEVT